MTRPGRLFGALAAGTLLAVVPAAAAFARWSSTGTGTGTARTTTLAAPTGVTVPGSATATVPVSWTASSAPNGSAVSGYYVTRTAGSTPAAACGTSRTALTTATSCTDTGLAGGAYTYTVTAAYRTWTATSSPSASVSVSAGPSLSTVSLVNGTGTAGVIDTGDKIIVTFARAMNPATICSTWTGTAVNGGYSTAGATVTVSGAGYGSGAVNDSLTAGAATCVGGLHFGVIDLRTPGYVNSDTPFIDSTVTYSTTSNALTIQLGTGNASRGVSSTTPVYSPDSAIHDADGAAVSPSSLTLATQKWF